MYQPVLCTDVRDLDESVQYDIWFDLLGFYPELHKKYINPLRQDREPGMYFVCISGLLYMIDWADKDFFYKNVFQLISYTQKLNNLETIYYINSNYILSKKHQKLRVKTKEKILTKNTEVSSSFIDKYITFTETNNASLKAYFEQYNVTEIPPNIIPISSYTITDVSLESTSTRTYRPNGVSMAYVYPGGNKKIYSPHTNKYYKWRSTANKNDVYANTITNEDDRLIITKSFKDVLVLNSLGYNSIGFHNEGTVPDEEIVMEHVEIYREIYILYDNDNAGIKAANKLQKKLLEYKIDTKIIFLDEYKDISDLIIDKTPMYAKNVLNKLIR